MEIEVCNAYANNLKNISVKIPIGKITALTGVSGSGKSTLLKEVIAAYGYRNFTRISSKTIKKTLDFNRMIEVEKISNLPISILIDVKNSVNISSSTVSTVSGIHEILRNLFTEFAEMKCLKCGNIMKRDYVQISKLSADLHVNEIFTQALEFINTNGCIEFIEYFDKEMQITKNEKKRAYATVYFTLSKINDKIVKEFNSTYGCRMRAFKTDSNETYDILREIECSVCHSIHPYLNRSRLSFNTAYSDGGGACRVCDGTGFITEINAQKLILDNGKGILDGAIAFVSESGIKYTTVSEKFIIALYKFLGIDIKTPLKEISSEDLKIILYGSKKNINFVDRTGGKKSLIFKGIINYLSDAYKAGKGNTALNSYIQKNLCPECKGTRLDNEVKTFLFNDRALDSILNLSLDELNEWCKSIEEKSVPERKIYLKKIISETENFKLLSCGHLSLTRESRTLSGGELQRIRVCALLNSNITNICYLLDEPSSGLHYSDVEKLGSLFCKIRDQGNTIIMVEHNRKLLDYCDHIIDMGPLGGKNGGSILFSDSISNIRKYNTATSKLFNDNEIKTVNFQRKCFEKTDFLSFNNLRINNLKNITVQFPRNSFSAVCGVSGSGKSTFVRDVVFKNIKKSPEVFGFSEVEYVSQTSKIASNASTVLSILDLTQYIAQLFSKKSKFPKQFFLMSNSDGKCPCCKGRGSLYSDEDDFLGVCENCAGRGFSDEVLKIKIDGLDIYQICNTNFENLIDIIKDNKIKAYLDSAISLGVGYLNFSRSTKSLSKGELQRVSLIKTLTAKENQKLILLDEPSKGLHYSDSIKLLNALHSIVENGNTVVAVEHNPELIKNADYVIEFGGTGITGGYILFQGRPENLKNTPTASIFEKYATGKIDSVNDNKEYLKIYDKKANARFLPFQINQINGNDEYISESARKSREDFLSVAIPNNAIFSKVNTTFINEKTPFIVTVDFLEKIKYCISLSEALGITDLLKNSAKEENAESIAPYVFDNNSVTGKCFVCEGKGSVVSVDENYFLSDGELSKECKKFLRNSTNYQDCSKLIKKDDADISKHIAEMNNYEKQILFWGSSKKYIVNKENIYWKGIIPYFIEYHKYYQNSDLIYKTKKEILCPVCEGKMLDKKYQHMKVLGLSYSGWMSLPIDDLLRSVSTCLSPSAKCLYESLSFVSELKLGKLCLTDELQNMDCITAGKVKFASLFLNNIYGIGVYLRNLKNLPDGDIVLIKEKLSIMARSNTIWLD